jgi:hypothetical protein
MKEGIRVQCVGQQVNLDSYSSFIQSLSTIKYDEGLEIKERRSLLWFPLDEKGIISISSFSPQNYSLVDDSRYIVSKLLKDLCCSMGDNVL